MNKLTIKRTDLLKCTVEGCENREAAERMGNYSIPYTPLIQNELVRRKVVCSDCTSTLRGQGVKIYRLVATMRAILHLQETHEREVAHATSVRSDVRAYALGLADAPVYSSSATFAMPTSKKVGHGFGCGLPINCCDHSQECGRFLVIGGELIGLCRLASEEIMTMNRERGNVGVRDRLFVHRDEFSARRFAESQNRAERPAQRPGLRGIVRMDKALGLLEEFDSQSAVSKNG